MAVKSQTKIRKIIKQTNEAMTVIGTYKPQFDPTIKMYAEMRYQYDNLMEEFYKNGCQITEEYTNKSGATNIRKTALYLSIESLRKDIVNHENILGLTPAGLKKINDEMKQGKKGQTKLEIALMSLEEI